MEEHFKNKLKHYKVDWDKEELLPDLEAALSKKKNSRKGIWFFLMAVFLLGIFLLGYNNLLKKSASSSFAKYTEENVEKQNSNIPQQTAKSSQDTNNISQGLNAAIGQHHVSKEEYSEKVNVLQNRSNKNKLIHNQAVNDLVEKTIAKEDESKDLTFEKRVNSTMELSPSLNSKMLSTQDLLPAKQTPTVDEDVFLHNNRKEDSRRLNELAYLPSLQLHLFRDSIRDLDIEKIETLDNFETSKKLVFFLESNVSVGFLQRNFSSSGGEWVKVYLDEKEELEQPILFDAISFEVGALINKKWSFQIGLEYQELRERFKHDILLNSDTTFVQFERAYYTVDSNMDSIFLAATRPLVENEIRRIKHWNKHSYISIPLTIGRRFRIGKTMLNASAGVSYALRHNFRGRTKRGQFTINENEAFGLKNRFGFHLGIGAEYSIQRNKVLFVKANFRKHPILDLSFSEISGEKSHLSYSLGLGLRFYLHSF